MHEPDSDTTRADRRDRYETLFASTSASIEKAFRKPGSLRGDKGRLIAGSLTFDEPTEEQDEEDLDQGQEEGHTDNKTDNKHNDTGKAKRKGWGQTENDDDSSEPTARIVSYSDSESDDEHPGPVLAKQLLSGGQSEDGGLENAKTNLATDFQSGWPLSNLWSKRKSKKRPRQETSKLRKPARVQQLAVAVTAQGADKVRQLRPATVLGFVARTGVVAALQRMHPQAAAVAEAAVVLASVPPAMWRRRGRARAQQALPGRLRPIYAAVSAFVGPVLAVRAAMLLKRLRPRKRRRLRRSITESVRTLREASQGKQDAEHVAAGMEPGRRPQTGREWASLYEIELAEMKRVLAAQDVSLSSGRFQDNDAELMRFAIAAGILQAHSPEEKAVAIEEAVVRLMGMLTWLRKYKFLPTSQLRNYHPLVRWQGWDSEGRPLLLIRIAKACNEMSGNTADAVADAIICQVDRACTELLSDTEGPDKIVAVLDARGASAIEATRHIKLFKDTAESLNQHYPARLHQLWLVELPPQLRWVLGAVKHQIHTSTSARIRTCTADDPACPLPAAMLDRPPMSPASSADTSALDDSDLRRVSIPELPMRSIPSHKTPQLAGRNRSPSRGEASRTALRSHLYSPSTSPASQRPSTDAATNTTPTGKPPLASYATQNDDGSCAEDESQQEHDPQPDDDDASAAAAKVGSSLEDDAAVASGQSSPHTPQHGLQSSPFKRGSIQDLATQPQPPGAGGDADPGEGWFEPTESRAELRRKSDAGELGEGEGPLGDSGGSDALWQLPPPSPFDQDAVPGDADKQASGPDSGIQPEIQAASTDEVDNKEGYAKGEDGPAPAQYPF